MVSLLLQVKNSTADIPLADKIERLDFENLYNLAIQLTIFASAVASLGVTIGLALSGTLQNFACGLLILFLKPFTVGDRILAQGHEGIVESIQIFYTIVKKEGSTVIIPNSKLSNEVIVKLLQRTPAP